MSQTCKRAKTGQRKQSTNDFSSIVLLVLLLQEALCCGCTIGGLDLPRVIISMSTLSLEMITTRKNRKRAIGIDSQHQEGGREGSSSSCGGSYRNRGRAPLPQAVPITSIAALVLLLFCCLFARSGHAFSPLPLSPPRLVSLSSFSAATRRPLFAQRQRVESVALPDDTTAEVVLVSPAPSTKELVADQTTTSVAPSSSSSFFSTSTIRWPPGFDFIQKLESKIDDLSGGWALSYADLSPDSDQTWGGRAFLATNLAYGFAGAIITFVVGDYTLGLLTELCALASYNYHYYQLLAHGQARAESVRLALLVDYVCAGASILTGTLYLIWTAPVAGVPTVAVGLTALSVAFLLASWNWEYGRPYMVLHGLWHLCSAAGGYLIADAYQQSLYASSSSVVVAVAVVTATLT
jgi:hypothetical protein